MQTPRFIPLAAALAGLVMILSGPALAQPRSSDVRPHPIRPRPDGVQSRTVVSARLDGSILQVRCEQTFVNDGRRLEEIEILLPVPADAVVTDGLLLADGREYRAEVLPADEARRIYQEIVRSRRDPALLELVGHGLIRLSAFPIPPGGERTVSFRYHQSLPVDQGRIRLALPIAALCGIGRAGPLEFRLEVEGNEPITQIYSPSHDLVIERDGPRKAHVVYRADPPDPRETLELITVRDTRSIGIDLRTARGRGEDDYFLLAVSPGWELLSQRHDTAQTQVLVLDTSGSMEGEKFEQARRALRRFLDEISPKDRFNLIAFSDEVDPLFEEGPRRARRETRREARAWLDRLQTGGGTAIADALEEACRARWEADLVLFLTDGLPTVGETDPDAILKRVTRAGSRLRFFAFGVGYDVDAHLLDDLARAGSGSVSYVRPGEDVAEAVTTLRRRVEHPAARKVRLEVRGAQIDQVFPEGPCDLFAGEPLLFAGRVQTNAGRATVRLIAEGPDGRRLRESWRIDFDDPRARSSAIPVLWASRKAAALITRIRREGHDARALEELRELSKRYGILNEEVALLAREDEPFLAELEDAAAPRHAGAGAVSAPSGSAARARFEMSKKVWNLGAVASADKLSEERGDLDELVRAGGITFRLEDDVWIDTRLAAEKSGRSETVRLRAYGSAYFELAGRSERLAAWLAVGERVQILLPGLVLEIDPAGADDIPERTMRRILEAVEQA